MNDLMEDLQPVPADLMARPLREAVGPRLLFRLDATEEWICRGPAEARYLVGCGVPRASIWTIRELVDLLGRSATTLGQAAAALVGPAPADRP